MAFSDYFRKLDDIAEEEKNIREAESDIDLLEHNEHTYTMRAAVSDNDDLEGEKEHITANLNEFEHFEAENSGFDSSVAKLS